MIRIRFFARLREALDCDFLDRRLLSAVNQEMANGQTPVRDGDEVAFFPPVTGG
jgi:molybdopterin synthase sulfur carrier subunit